MTRDELYKLCDYLLCNDASMEAQREAAAFIQKSLEQRNWVELTEQEIKKVWHEGKDHLGIAKAFNDKLKEKNYDA